MNVDSFLILLPPFLTGSLILFTHLILGRQVLKRGIVFIDLAIAQVAALGAVVSHFLFEDNLLMIAESETARNVLAFLMPFLFSTVCAVLISQLSRIFSKDLEAIIGCIYVLSATMTIILLSNDPHGTEHMSTTLQGAILWSDWNDFFHTALISTLFIAIVMSYSNCLETRFFYPLFAIMITFSVQLAGVYMVFSSLIMPAIAVSELTGKRALIWGSMLGVSSIAAGLILSALFDTPGGASIIVTLAALCTGFKYFSETRHTATRIRQ